MFRNVKVIQKNQIETYDFFSVLFISYISRKIRENMNQDLFEWILLFARWLHITTAVVWIGESIFFMWLDRTLERNQNSANEGHVGELWMVHGGGFYNVEKMLMGPTKVPQVLHWFKWESYWTWMSGAFLVIMIYYTGDGTYLLNSSVSSVTFPIAVSIGIFSIIGSWIFYDFLWERNFTKNKPILGHILTILWFAGMSYFLCHTLSGRAAYIHIGGMLGTWMTANVFLRIIPRQVKMVEASKNNLPVNQEWGKNAKNRSTHNTYFALPVIFIMLSNHFPMTYGHTYNWVILLLISAAGACIREYFVVRIHNPKRSKIFALVGILIITSTVFWTSKTSETSNDVSEIKTDSVIQESIADTFSVVSGSVNFEGIVPKGSVLSLPAVCAKENSNPALSNEVLVENGKLQNVVIRVIKGLEGKEYSSDIPTNPVLLDQKGCVYHPRVAVAVPGQKIIVQNSDQEFHNVHYISEKEGEKNVSQPTKGIKSTFSFSEPQLVKFKCDLHPWMGAIAIITDNPFSSVSNSNGEFSLLNLPDGNYTVEAWHEILGKQTQEIMLTESNRKSLKLTFTFKKD